MTMYEVHSTLSYRSLMNKTKSDLTCMVLDCVTEIERLAQERDAQYDLNVSMVAKHAAQEAEIERLTHLAYIGDHLFEDNTYRARYEEQRVEIKRFRSDVEFLLGDRGYYRDQCEELQKENAKLKELWFKDADPEETEYGKEYRGEV